MKKLFLILALTSFTYFANAQIKVITGGNVGIGTTSPTQQLTLRKMVGDPAIAFNRGDVTSWHIGVDSSDADKMKIGTGHSVGTYDWFTVATTGNVGIGTTTPHAKLTINGGKTNSTGISVKSGDVDLLLTEDSASNVGKIQVMSGNYYNIGNTPYTLSLQPQGGNVGIGTTSPSSLLEVAGLIKFDNSLYNTFLGSTNGGTTTTGANNTFLGFQSGNSNTTGANNTFSGYRSGYTNIAGGNTFYGSQCGVSTTSGESNTFSGFQAGNTNTTAGYDAYYGYKAGYSNTTGQNNTFTGYKAGYSNTSAHYNTFYGTISGYSNNIGICNTTVGYSAGFANTTGNFNTFIGQSAGSASVTGNGNTLLGNSANVSSSGLSNSTAIGNDAIVSASSCVRIGNTNVTQIGGQVGWTNLSDGRFKTNVTENVKGLEFIKKLRPVTYQLNTQTFDSFIKQNMSQVIDSSGNGISNISVDYSASMAIIHSGFIAQEVEQAENECGFTSSIVSAPTNNNDTYALCYAEFVVPLVKAVQELNTTITEQGQEIQVLKTQINDQDEKITALETELTNCCNIKPTEKMMNQTQGSNNTNNNSTTATLYQNVPNPFKIKTTIRYYLPSESNVASMLIFDMQGKLIKTYNINTSGDGNVEINAGELQPGMYMYSLIANSKEVDTKKMILTE